MQCLCILRSGVANPAGAAPGCHAVLTAGLGFWLVKIPAWPSCKVSHDDLNAIHGRGLRVCGLDRERSYSLKYRAEINVRHRVVWHFPQTIASFAKPQHVRSAIACTRNVLQCGLAG